VGNLARPNSTGDQSAQIVDGALCALSEASVAIGEALGEIPSKAGLYAIYGGREVWRELGLGAPPDGRPLYVGKDEDSLVARDLRTHFETGRTGSSTLRRSCAALLAQQLDLHAQPRNPKRPERYANYALPAEDDARLTGWMRAKLRLAVWPKHGHLALAEVEQQILVRLLPPLNLTGIRTPWTDQVKAARRALADEARAWAQEHDHEL
jgi:hypothetical protein